MERPSKYQVDLGELGLQPKYEQMAQTRGVSVQTLIRYAVSIYYQLHRMLDEADIECEPGIPWKYSVTEGEPPNQVIIKDIQLP